MTRGARAVVLLAALANTSLLAALTLFVPSASAADGNKVTYTCGTVPETIKRADGRVNTWNLSAFSFTPDNRSTKPLAIDYRSITRLEYGHTPPRPVETPDTAPVTLPCALKPERKNYYLTIFYKEVPPDDDADEDVGKSAWQEQRDKKTQARQDRRDGLVRWDGKDLRDPKDDKDQKDPKNPRDQRDEKDARDRRDRRGETNRTDAKAQSDRRDKKDRKDRKDQKDPKDQKDDKDENEESRVKKEKEYFAVFELGDGMLRPALRILETRSGKRVNYQDANARKAAR